MRQRQSSRPLRRSVFACLAALYLGSVTGLPVLHAQTEVARTAAGVEASHSDSCPTVHTERLCVICGGVQLPTPPPSRHVPADLEIGTSPTEVGSLRAGRSYDPGAHRVRAPPVR